MPEDPPVVVALEDVGFRYTGGANVLDAVGFEVISGEFVSVIGPSGCGKSTLLAIIAGLLPLSTGHVRWAAAEEDRRKPTRRRLSLVFQKDTLFPWLTVEGNIRFPLRYLALSREERDERVDMLLRMGDLEEFRGAHPRHLSGGMRRRLSLLVGIAPFPQLLLLDEPFSALDEPTRVALHAELMSVIRTLEITTVLVTHDLGEAITLSDKVVRLTGRPTRVAQTYRVDLGVERDVLAIRESEEFQALYARIWADLYRGRDMRLVTSSPPGRSEPPPNCTPELESGVNR